MKHTSFKRSMLSSTMLLLVLLASCAVYVWAEKAIDRANDQRFISAQLADQLRHSSDDLTKMVRFYVATGNPKYIRYFQAILDIRDGRRPRPDGYNRIYWDFVLDGEADPDKVTSGDRSEALLDRMRQAGFTDREFAKLEEAKRKSDQLTSLEYQAIELRRSQGDAGIQAALALVYGQDYVEAKAAIMHPLNELDRMTEQRTQEQVEFTIRRALGLRYVSVAFGLLTILSLYHNYRTLQKLLGGTPDEVHRQIKALGRIDADDGEDGAPAKSANSVLGWLGEARQTMRVAETARRQAEAQLRADEQRLRGLYEMSPLGLALTDMQGRFIELNAAYCRITGYSEEELKALDYWALTPQRYEADEARQLEMLRTLGSYGPYQKEYIRKDGSLVSVNLNGMLIRGADGQDYIWSFVEDITESLGRERDLIRSNAELEQFAYIASHDLQTPIRNMVIYAQLLKRQVPQQLEGEAGGLVDLIVDNGKRMSALVHDMLEFARVTQSATPLQALSAKAAVDQAIANLQSLIASSEAEIRLGDLPMVVGDEIQLVSLFQNLIGNAIKYRHSDRPVRIEIEASLDEDNLWLFTVRDNGVGIDPAHHDKIFEMFQRVSSSGDKEGTGIGLAICKRIAHRLGGNIAVRASSPEGTVFSVTLRKP